MPKQYLPTFRDQVIISCQNGRSIEEASQKFSVARSTIYRWVKESQSSNSLCSMPDHHTFQRQYTRLNHILQIIQLSAIIDSIPLNKRLDILAKLHEQFDQYSVHELCEALNVARGTFYNHIFRKADRSKQIQEQQQLMLQAIEAVSTFRIPFACCLSNAALRSHFPIQAGHTITPYPKPFLQLSKRRKPTAGIIPPKRISEKV